MYDWLLFDADNTLFDFSAAEAHSLERTLALTEIKWSQEVLGIYREINHIVWSEYEDGLMPKHLIRNIRFERLLDRFRVSHDIDELSLAYRQGLASSHHLMEYATELLEIVSQKYRLGLITNGLQEVQYPRLKNTGIGKYFEVIVVSDEIGVAKPQAAFFNHAFNLMGQPNPSRVLVIGDSPKADIGGALSYGCHACWMKNPGEVRKPLTEPHYTVNNLRELERYYTG
ncbi:MAG: YjjG family noncanonical pyrimidine nucleotidase [Bacteroidota bacterium]